MVISPLSEDDTRKLGATLAIATPVILIKELFENALDSGATTVVVLISPNTVDRIEVRDNGHGIDPSDFDALGRSGYTSKLKSLHELATVGARSLGFRGVALASINTLAEVTITTRTSSQPVAEVLRLVDGGGIVKEGRAGNPVGTAVCANNLFANFPVRQRSVIKEAHKNLAKIKELLQAYTFARSGTKVAFRVFGKPESTWCYTAQTGGGVKEAARQLFGHDVASRCSLKTYSADIKEPREQEKTGAGKSLSFEGFLPHAGADPQKIAGAFFSVDSRPLSPIRGTGKKLLSVFRAHYNQFPPGTKEEKATKGILIRLNIVCPPGSYDVNVEPAKDDVIFVDEEWVIGHFKQYLLSVYPRKEDDYENEGGRGYTTAGLETPPASSSGPKDTCKPIQDLHQGWTVDMSRLVDSASEDEDSNSGDEYSTVVTHHPESRHKISEGVNEESPLEGLNPWSIAALAASRRPRIPRTPRPTSYQHRVYSLSPNSSADMSDDEQDWEEGRPPRRTLLPGHQQRRVPVGQPLSQPTANLPGVPYRRPLPVAGASSGRKPRTAGSSGRAHPQARWDTSQSLPSRPRQRQAGPELVQTRLTFGDQEISQRRKFGGGQYTQPSASFGPPLDASRYDHHGATERSRNRDAYDEHVEESHARPHPRAEFLQSGIPDIPRPQTPPVSGTLEAAVALVDVEDEESAQTALAAEDRRAYLIRRQRSVARNPKKRHRRLLTELLPLEVIPLGSETQSLVLTLDIDTCRLSTAILARETPMEAGLGKGDLKSELEDGRLAFGRQISALLSSIGIRGSDLELQPLGLDELPSR